MNTKENVEAELKELWNRYSPYYRGTLLTPSVQEMGRCLIESIVPCPGGIVHDAGCGIGFWLIPILKKTGAQRVIGTDYSEGMLEIARKRLVKTKESQSHRIELRFIDLTRQWPEEKFDVQIFHLFLYYLPYNGWKEILRKTYASTKPGGYLYASTLLKGFSVGKASKKYLLRQFFFTPPNALLLLIKAVKIIKEVDKFAEKHIIEYPSQQEFIDYLKETGFTNIEVVGEFMEGWEIIIRARKPLK